MKALIFLAYSFLIISHGSRALGSDKEETRVMLDRDQIKVKYLHDSGAEAVPLDGQVDLLGLVRDSRVDQVELIPNPVRASLDSRWKKVVLPKKLILFHLDPATVLRHNVFNSKLYAKLAEVREKETINIYDLFITEVVSEDGKRVPLWKIVTVLVTKEQELGSK